jgi:hypothetical protein
MQLEHARRAAPGTIASPCAAPRRYIEKHGLEKKVEEVLNLCVKEKPEEPLSFMVGPRRGPPISEP